jgi:hypothetical protein
VFYFLNQDRLAPKEHTFSYNKNNKFVNFIKSMSQRTRVKSLSFALPFSQFTIFGDLDHHLELGAAIP